MPAMVEVCPNCGEEYNHRVDNGYRNTWPSSTIWVCTTVDSEAMYVHTEPVEEREDVVIEREELEEEEDISFGKRKALEIKEIAEDVIPDKYNETYEIVAGGGCAILQPGSVDAPVVRAIQDSDKIRIYYIRDNGVYLTFN